MLAHKTASSSSFSCARGGGIYSAMSWRLLSAAVLASLVLLEVLDSAEAGNLRAISSRSLKSEANKKNHDEPAVMNMVDMRGGEVSAPPAASPGDSLPAAMEDPDDETPSMHMVDQRNGNDTAPPASAPGDVVGELERPGEQNEPEEQGQRIPEPELENTRDGDDDDDDNDDNDGQETDDNFNDGDGNTPQKIDFDDDDSNQKTEFDAAQVAKDYESREERKVREIGGFGVLFGLLAMVFTAWQMSENPDGLYAALCRLILTIIGLFLSVVARPCRSCLGTSAGNRHHGHMPVSTMDYGYRDPSLELS